jgi:hypothetical protein
VVLVVGFAVALSAHRVPPDSMAPTLSVGDKILVLRLGHHPHVRRFPTTVTVPKGHWPMLDDNRGASDDSRSWGMVPTRAIIGRRLLTY